MLNISETTQLLVGYSTSILPIFRGWEYIAVYNTAIWATVYVVLGIPETTQPLAGYGTSIPPIFREWGYIIPLYCVEWGQCMTTHGR